MFKPNKGKSFEQNLPNNKRRKYLTLVAVITDEPAVQKRMPQFIIGNFHSFLKRDMDLLVAAAGENLVLIRYVMKTIYSLLRNSLAGRKALGLMPIYAL